MEKSFFFNSKMVDGKADRVYSAEDIAEREACLISDGVLHGDSLRVEAYSSSFVTVGRGAASVRGYTYLNTGDVVLELDEGDAEYDRIDTVVLRLNLAARTIRAAVVKGTPASSPVGAMPEDSTSVKELPLAEVIVEAGSVPVIEPHHVKDKRPLAGIGQTKEDMTMILREYLGEIDPVNKTEIASLRRIIGMVDDGKGGDAVLCGDGKYRRLPPVSRELCAEWIIAGEDAFSLADCPSEEDMYDIEIQGGGGGGGSYNGTAKRGGGGGGGAFVEIKGARILKDTVKVCVGHGGKGGVGKDGEDGGASYFDGYYAEGGKGGSGGISAEGGAGGVAAYRGGDGGSGEPMDGTELYSACGKGGDSRYGVGAAAPYGRIAADGNNAENIGAGGSGASCTAGAFDKKGGNGADGVIRLYRYVKLSDGEVI